MGPSSLCPVIIPALLQTLELESEDHKTRKSPKCDLFQLCPKIILNEKLDTERLHIHFKCKIAFTAASSLANV